MAQKMLRYSFCLATRFVSAVTKYLHPTFIDSNMPYTDFLPLSDNQTKDFFRYTNFNYRIFGEFKIVAEKLVLTLKPPPPSSKASSSRPILSPLPYNTHVEFIKDGTYQRGTPSPLVRALGGMRSVSQRGSTAFNLILTLLNLLVISILTQPNINHQSLNIPAHTKG